MGSRASGFWVSPSQANGSDFVDILLGRNLMAASEGNRNSSDICDGPSPASKEGVFISECRPQNPNDLEKIVSLRAPQAFGLLCRHSSGRAATPPRDRARSDGRCVAPRPITFRRAVVPPQSQSLRRPVPSPAHPLSTMKTGRRPLWSNLRSS